MPGKASSKPAGKNKIQAGGSGKMQSFTPVGNQPSGISSVKNTGGSKKWSAPSTGGKKMHGFSPVKAQKSGRSSQS